MGGDDSYTAARLKKLAPSWAYQRMLCRDSHLVLEESCQQQTLGPRGFHEPRVVPQRRIRHEMVEHRAETRRRRQVGVGVRGDLGVVRQQAGVVEQLVSIDGGLGDVLQAHHEKLEGLPMIDCEQLT